MNKSLMSCFLTQGEKIYKLARDSCIKHAHNERTPASRAQSPTRALSPDPTGDFSPLSPPGFGLHSPYERQSSADDGKQVIISQSSSEGRSPQCRAAQPPVEISVNSPRTSAALHINDVASSPCP